MSAARARGARACLRLAAFTLLPAAQVQASAQSSLSVTVPVADRLTLTATNVTTAEGASIGGALGTLTDGTASRPSTAFAASIAWGDGTSSTATVSGSGGTYRISASHAYTEEGDDTMTITVVATGGGGSRASATGRMHILDAALTASAPPLSGRVRAAATFVVATFSDADPQGAASDFRATVDWGDGTSSTGTVKAAASGGFTVTATHAYTRAGSFSFRVRISDAGGASTTASNTATIRGR